KQDHYRADCKPHEGGCRNCGQPPTGRFRFYCGDACRDVFEADHFWGTARWAALERAALCPLDGPNPRLARMVVVCACCGILTYRYEVNHIAPVNGDRGFFSCANHQDNLEVLCHQCHVMATREQRRRGIIGPDGTCEPLRAVELLLGLAEDLPEPKSSTDLRQMVLL
ncbi:hypothetical protein LCGC14_1207300, partial [marine sediment metagenome]